MTPVVREICAKSILSPSKIYPWVINPYTGCQHGCSYCYARFMKRVTGHREPWGEFVDVKINAPEVLRVEIKKKRRGRVWVSGVCDPYQPLEAQVPADPAVPGDTDTEHLAGHHPDTFTSGPP